MPATLSHVPASTQRYAGVDVLRGLSILSVILFHLHRQLAYDNRPLNTLMSQRLFAMLFNNALDGVPVFFAISGFLITFTCLRRFHSLRNVVPGVFYRIRFARIAPLLLLVLAVLSVLFSAGIPGYLFLRNQATLGQVILAALTFHINLLEAHRGSLPPSWDVLWSLSVEEMFYLFFPLACLVLRWRNGRYVFGALLLTLIVLGPSARITADPIWHLKSYLGNMDCIALGCLTALLADWLQRHRRVPSDRVLLALIGCGIADIALLIRPDQAAYLYPLWRTGTWTTLMILGVCAVLFGTVLRNRPGRACSAPLRWFGTRSYELYLTHQIVIISLGALPLMVGPATGRSLFLWPAVFLAATAAVGWLISRYVSEPANLLLRGARPPSTERAPSYAVATA